MLSILFYQCIFPLRASVSFSVEGDVQPFNEVTALVQNVNATLSLLGFPVLDILQGEQ